MNQKTLIVLAVVALLAVVAAIALHRSQAPASEERAAVEATWVVPALRDHVNDVDRVTVTGAGGKVLATLERGKEGWSVAEKGGYPVDTGKLRSFLLKLADARQLEQKTSNPERYPDIGVEDVAGTDAKSVQVRLEGLASPVEILIGKPAPRGGGTYVRRVGEAPAWLASGTLTVEKDPASWLRRDLADIAAERIKSVAITRPDGSTVAASKADAGDANFALQDIPKGREAVSPYAVNGLASLLAGLRFEDVLPAEQAKPPEKPLQAHFVTFDGVVIDVTAWAHEGKDYARFAASLDEEQADAGIAAAQAKDKAAYEAAKAAAAPDPADDKDDKDAKGVRDAAPATGSGPAPDAEAPIEPLAATDPARDRENRLAAVRKQVETLRATFDGWTYVLPAYKYAAIDKSMTDLLQPVEEKKPAKKGGK